MRSKSLIWQEACAKVEVCNETEWVISDRNGIYDLERYARRSEAVLCVVS